MLSQIWFSFLYQPLFNALIWIYSNVANKNLGWAVVWLTIFLRLILLPLTIISVRNSGKQRLAEEEAEAAIRSYKGDEVAQKEAFRQVMKKHKISPWAKSVTLVIQVVVLILLYQVFIRGISGDKIFKVLYPALDFPGKININFYGFNIGRVHDAFWAGICAVYLFMSIFISDRHRKHWQSSEVVFLVVFPLFTFVALWILPMVKSLFILTTMAFSDTVSIIYRLFSPKKKT